MGLNPRGSEPSSKISLNSCLSWGGCPSPGSTVAEMKQEWRSQGLGARIYPRFQSPVWHQAPNSILDPTPHSWRSYLSASAGKLACGQALKQSSAEAATVFGPVPVVFAAGSESRAALGTCWHLRWGRSLAHCWESRIKARRTMELALLYLAIISEKSLRQCTGAWGPRCHPTGTGLGGNNSTAALRPWGGARLCLLSTEQGSRPALSLPSGVT